LSTDALLTIADGPIVVQLLPHVGARLHRIQAFGHDLLRTPDDPGEHARDPLSWGAYVMAPWCNRIGAGATDVDGHVVNVASNFTDGTAIHGQVYDVPWRQREAGLLWVRGGGDGWPWAYESTIRVTVHGAVVLIRQSLTNLAATPMPAGLGLHPWFRRPLEVRVDAASVLGSNLDPDAIVEPCSGSLDLRTMQSIPDDLDASWLKPGDPAVELRWPELGLTAAMRVRSDAGLSVALASPSSLDAVAIEPQTHLPQGLRRYLRGEPGRLHPLAPRATISLTTQVTFQRP
jgi:aldose 1-epimerase